MRGVSLVQALNAPVRLRGIRVGTSVDVLLDPADWHAVGFEVHCGDDAPRFLPCSTVTLGDGELVIDSALTLLEEVEFYRTRSLSLRRLLGSPLERDGERIGDLRDLLISADGAVQELVLSRDGEERRMPGSAGTYTVASRDAA